MSMSSACVSVRYVKQYNNTSVLYPKLIGVSGLATTSPSLIGSVTPLRIWEYIWPNMECIWGANSVALL